jgi:hypothetical protein
VKLWHYKTKNFKIPPWVKKVIYITEFVILGKNLPIYKVKQNNVGHGELSKENFKTIFSTIIFKNVNFRYVFHFDQVNNG